MTTSDMDAATHQERLEGIRKSLSYLLNVWCELKETRNHYSRKKGASGR